MTNIHESAGVVSDVCSFLEISMDKLEVLADSISDCFEFSGQNMQTMRELKYKRAEIFCWIALDYISAIQNQMERLKQAADFIAVYAREQSVQLNR